MNNNFGAAIEALKSGKKVQRIGWNGKGMYLYMQHGQLAVTPVDTTEMSEEDIAASAEGAISDFHGVPLSLFNSFEGDGASVFPCIVMSTVDGSLVQGWLASQTDMLAEDWQTVE